MKKIIIAVATFVVVIHSLSANQLKQNPKSAKLPYAKQYRILKETFKLDKDELSRTETLEAVVVKFAELFERTNVLIAQQTERISALEAENFKLKVKLDESEKRIANAEARLKLFDDDLNKVFKWMNKVDDDLYNEIGFGIGGRVKRIEGKLEKLDAQINNFYNGLEAQIDRLRSAVNANSQNIQSLWNSIRKW